jgi:HK97 family phage prohead protease
MLLHKRISLNDVDLKMDAESGKFSGYASVFGGVDSQGDTIIKGAFESTLRNNGKPKMYLEHSWASSFGSGSGLLPIGKFTKAAEDDHGLLIEGELTPGMSVSSDVLAAMKHGTIDGLSVGGYVKKGDYEETDTGRVIRKWSKLIEVSVVAQPADQSARIASVKSEDWADALDGVDTIREFERFLRDAGGFSKGAAQALVARVKTLPDLRDAGADEAAKYEAQLLEKIMKVAA